MPPREQAFVEHLQGLAQRQDRGALAALRSGLGQPNLVAAPMHPHVVPFLDPEGEWEDWRYYLVAALFASHPESTGSGNLGESFRALNLKAASASGEARFIALLSAHRDDLPGLLRQAVGLLRSHDVPVNWAQLLRDLRAWDHPDQYVQRRWARSFYRQQRPEGAESENGGTQ